MMARAGNLRRLLPGASDAKALLERLQQTIAGAQEILHGHSHSTTLRLRHIAQKISFNIPKIPS
jgi:hypothetical protein